MSIAGAVVGPVVSSLMRSALARRNTQTPLMMECLMIVATLRSGSQRQHVPVTVPELWRDAEKLAAMVSALDDDESLRRAIDDIADTFGGEQ